MSAPSAYVGLDGNAWQRLCLQVLHHYHGEDLIPIPDKDSGDAGLEAFTTTGLAYQCYSPDEPLKVEQRYRKHRDKMTKDVGKFIDNADKLCSLLGQVKVRRWILLVPLTDSRDLVAHASVQTDRLLKANLRYAAEDIFVLTRTLEAYEASHNFVVGSHIAKFKLPTIPALPNYSEVDSELIRTMRDKLGKLPKLADAGRRQRFVNEMLKSNILAQSHRAFIRDHFPQLDEDIVHYFLDLESRLDTEFLLSEDPPARMLQSLIRKAEERVREVVPSMGVGDARAIAEGQIADWLMRCPLDFEVEDEGSAA